VLLFTVATILGTGFLFGIGPALTVVRGDLASSLKETGWRSTAGPGRRWLRDTLVIAEVALAFVLLSGAGLLLRSFYELLRVDPGIDTANVLTMTLPMTADRYPQSAQITGYLSQVQERVAAVPGVRQIAATSVLPFRGWGWEMPFQIEGQPLADNAGRPSCFFKVVSPSYFRALGIHLREGRELADTDAADSPLVLVINESMARRYFGGRDPVGKRAFLPRIISGNRRGPETAWEVVGIVADEKVKSLRDFSPGVYASYRQSPSLGVSLVVRGSGDSSRLTPAIRMAVQQLNPSQPVGDVRMLEDIKSESLGSNRLRTGLLALFAFLALLLATIGIYGVLSYSVSRRTQEMGIRAALGATRGNQLRLILGNGLSLTGIGIAIGVLGSLAISGVLSNLLFGVSARDPRTLVLVGLVLAGVAAAACYLPARRATRVDPVIALRHE
jgi:putative ABC transport system permease protein